MSAPTASTGAGTTTLPLPIATLVIFIILSQPLLFVLFKHGRAGIMGWSILFAFCGVRIVGAALQIHSISSPSGNITSSLILSNIGLSPLLLGSQGVLHEARLARGVGKGKEKREWAKVVLFHMAVIGAMVLIIIGILNAIHNMKPGEETYRPVGLMKAGCLLLLACWSLLTYMVLGSLRQTRTDDGAWRDGSILLKALIICLPLIGMRDVFSALSTFISGDAFRNNLAAKVILSTMPEMLVVAILVTAGIMAKDIAGMQGRVGHAGEEAKYGSASS